MAIDLEEVTIAEKLKRIAAYRGYSMTKLGNEFNRRYGTKYNQQSFSRKLGNGTISCDELKKFGEILGFDIKLELRE